MPNKKGRPAMPGAGRPVGTKVTRDSVICRISFSPDEYTEALLSWRLDCYDSKGKEESTPAQIALVNKRACPLPPRQQEREAFTKYITTHAKFGAKKEIKRNLKICTLTISKKAGSKMEEVSSVFNNLEQSDIEYLEHIRDRNGYSRSQLEGVAEIIKANELDENEIDQLADWLGVAAMFLTELV